VNALLLRRALPPRSSSFDNEAANRALAVSGLLARLTPTLAGALTGL
jgi:hypothetical protein